MVRILVGIFIILVISLLIYTYYIENRNENMNIYQKENNVSLVSDKDEKLQKENLFHNIDINKSKKIVQISKDKKDISKLEYNKNERNISKENNIKDVVNDDTLDDVILGKSKSVKSNEIDNNIGQNLTLDFINNSDFSSEKKEQLIDDLAYRQSIETEYEAPPSEEEILNMIIEDEKNGLFNKLNKE